MKDKKYHIMYETINLVNNKKYRGRHSTNNLGDNYIGSGKTMKKAIKKYGKINFKMEILQFCDSFEELIEKESIYVNKEWINRKDTYNIIIGGAGIIPGTPSPKKGIKMSDKARKNMSISAKGKILSDKTKKKISDAHKGNNNFFYGKTHSDEVRKKISLACSGENHPNYGKSTWNKGIKMTNEFRKKISNGHKNSKRSINRQNKINNIDLIKLKEFRSNKLSMTEIGKIFNVDRSIISKKCFENSIFP